jgi:CheY-like chemotaxis protein
VCRASAKPGIGGGELAPTSRIHLVDDNESVRTTFRLVLEHSGFEVITAAGGERRPHPDRISGLQVLLSDLHMPEAGDGLTV